MTVTSLAWCNGVWDRPERLSIPLNDRGLTLADGVFETMLVRDGQPLLLARHLQRMEQGCQLLQLGPPPAADRVTALATEGCQRLARGNRQVALRITLSRGSGSRGLAPPTSQQPRLWLQLTVLQPDFASVAVVTSQLVRRHGDSAASRCKTLSYTNAVIARHEAVAAGADDALILGGAGTYCSATAANLWACPNDCWVTPGVAEGCLPGVMRAVLLKRPNTSEAPISRARLLTGGGFLLNSLGCRPISRVDGQQPQQQLSPEHAEELFEALLQQGSAEPVDVGEKESSPGGEEDESQGR